MPTTMRDATVGLILCFVCGSTLAANPEPFTAICTVLKSHRYDSGYRYDGSRMEPEWSENEKFFVPDWSFSYRGGDRIMIAGKESPIVAYSEKLVFVPEYSSADIGASLWTFVIHLEMQEILATEVNGFTGGAPGIKGRLVSLDCKFSSP